VINLSFPISLSALALNMKTRKPTYRASAAFPHKRSRASQLPRGLVRGETLALLGLIPSQALPTLNQSESFYLPPSPSRPFLFSALPRKRSGTPGVVLSAYRRLPSKGAPARLGFLTGCPPLPIEKVIPRGLFFHLHYPKTLSSP
jgi:hypothetical protein